MFIETALKTQKVIMEVDQALEGQEWSAKDRTRLFKLLFQKGAKTAHWEQYVESANECVRY